MQHVPEGTLRRLIDEPFAVADRHVRHVESCRRCRHRADEIATDAAAVGAWLAPPPPRAFADPAPRVRDMAEGPVRARPVHVPAHRHWRVVWPSLGTGATVAAVGVVVAGVAAATSLTTVFAPTSVTPVPVGTSGLQPIATLLGATRTSLVGLDPGSGTRALAYGTLSWRSLGPPEVVSSLAAANAATGLDVTLPTSLPNGVGAPTRYVAMREVTATVRFDSRAGAALAGSTLALSVGPGVAVLYGATAGGATTMGIATITRPVVTSTGATAAALDQFLLSRPGLPAALALELRLGQNLSGKLPIPIPAGVDSTTVRIGAAPAIVLSDAANAASAAIWEDAGGQVHLVAGLLSRQDVLGVADQIH